MRTFTISWTDLDAVTQQEMIDGVKADIMGDYENEGKGFLLREWAGGYTPKTWEEAFCRMYAIDHDLWKDVADPSTFDWKMSVDAYAAIQAEKKCSHSVRDMKVLI